MSTPLQYGHNVIVYDITVCTAILYMLSVPIKILNYVVKKDVKMSRNCSLIDWKKSVLILQDNISGTLRPIFFNLLFKTKPLSPVGGLYDPPFKIRKFVMQ